MSWYKEYGDEWKDIIETVAREMGRTEQMIEKDTLQSMILFELSKEDIPFVFKGGTSLSKAYGIIDRFSEDIDLSLNRKPTESEKKKVKDIIISIAERHGMQLLNPDEIKLRYDYNRYVFTYNSFFSSFPQEIIIETSFYQTSYPVELHEVKSYVGQFCQERDIKMPIPFEAVIADMKVQSLERTFIDKVFAICDYRIQDVQDRDSRHLYDIAKLLPHVSLNQELDRLIDNVRDDRMQSKNNPSSSLAYNIPKMLEEIISSHFYEADYNSITQKLLYEDMTYEEAIKNGIAIVANSDVFIYKKKKMKPKSPRSIELYNILKKRGYPEDFCDGITKNLNTDWTANRMIGYLSHYQKLSPEEIVDEMLAILSDRNRIMQKHATQEANDKWNLIMAQGLGENLDEE